MNRYSISTVNIKSIFLPLGFTLEEFVETAWWEMEKYPCLRNLSGTYWLFGKTAAHLLQFLLSLQSNGEEQSLMPFFPCSKYPVLSVSSV